MISHILSCTAGMGSILQKSGFVFHYTLVLLKTFDALGHHPTVYYWVFPPRNMPQNRMSNFVICVHVHINYRIFLPNPIFLKIKQNRYKNSTRKKNPVWFNSICSGFIIITEHKYLSWNFHSKSSLFHHLILSKIYT